eukprot:scaffold7540_cov68-Phaeocystis_antarctica.AAC.3
MQLLAPGANRAREASVTYWFDTPGERVLACGLQSESERTIVPTAGFHSSPVASSLRKPHAHAHALSPCSTVLMFSAALQLCFSWLYR